MTTETTAELSAEEISGALREFNRTDSGIAELEMLYAGVIYDVRTPEGMRAAKKARKKVRDPRYVVERLRKEAKAPILELGRRLDSTAKALTARLVAIEEPIDAQIKAEERRVEAERRREQERVEGHRRRLDAIESHAPALLRSPDGPEPGQVQAAILKVERIGPAEFEEFEAEAAEARDRALRELNGILETARRREQERAELERLRKAEAERAEAAERAERERAQAHATDTEDPLAASRSAAPGILPGQEEEKPRRAPFGTTSKPPVLGTPSLGQEPPQEPPPWDDAPAYCESCGEAAAYSFGGEAALCPRCFSHAAQDAIAEAGLGDFCARLLRLDGVDAHYLCLTPRRYKGHGQHSHNETGHLVEC